jgi:hypothetical protein
MIRAKADEIEHAIEDAAQTCAQCGAPIRNRVERANGIYCSEDCADVNEPTEPHEPEEGDWITEDYRTWRMFNGHHHDQFTLPEGADWRAALDEQMKRDHYWPNLWLLSDHGNWHLLDMEAE